MATSPNPNTTSTTTANTTASPTTTARPSTTTAPVATTTSVVRAQTTQAPSPSATLPIHPQQQQQQQNLFTSVRNQNPPQNQGVVYAFPPSNRGYVHRGVRPQQSQQEHPLPAHHAVGVSYGPNSTVGLSRSHPQFLFDGVGAGAVGGFAQHSTTHLAPHLVRQHPQSQLQHYVSGGAGGVVMPVNSAKGIPNAPQQPKNAPSPSPVSNSNGYKNQRDGSKDDTVVTVRGRKVRITEGASLYALCRSWLRNGFPEDSQPRSGDAVRSLPRPLPIPVVDTRSPKNEGEEVEEDVDEESIDQLSTKDLLNQHVQRAKKVRVRLREERAKRIARYKTRLTLLLPPQAEQWRTDAESGN